MFEYRPVRGGIDDIFEIEYNPLIVSTSSMKKGWNAVVSSSTPHQMKYAFYFPNFENVLGNQFRKSSPIFMFKV